MEEERGFPTAEENWDTPPPFCKAPQACPRDGGTMRRTTFFCESMNGAHEAPNHTYTHTQMHGCTRLHTQPLLFTLPFRVIYSKAQNSTRSPQILTQPHTWSHTFCTTPRQMNRIVGTRRDLYTRTFTHGFSCPNTARINTILTR